MTAGADSSLCLRLAKELCSAFSLCAKLISHVATSMGLAALLRPRPRLTVLWELLRDGLHFLNVAARSRIALAAEVLFLGPAQK